MSGSIWSTLGLAPTNDADAIRRAYARRLRQVHPEDDPQGFQDLRAAYDHASHLARNGWAASPSETEDDVDGAPALDLPLRVSDGPEQDGVSAPGPFRTDLEAAAKVNGDLDRELTRDHQALCDHLSALVARPDGDRHEALSAMLRIFRSPAMESLTTHDRTEHWLGSLIGHGGPVVDDLVEPAIQYFGWDTRRVGLDLRHAEPVLRRRETGILLSRLDRGDDPDHETWRALKRKSTRRNRLYDRLTPGFADRVERFLNRLDFDAPALLDRLNPETVELWRMRQARPVLGPIFLWTLVLAPPAVAFAAIASGGLGLPPWATFLAVLALTGSILFALGVGHLHFVSRPRLAWRASDPWGRPLWLRFGWAPAALLLPVLAGLLPQAPWSPLLAVPAAAALWAWARITTAHIHLPAGLPRDWSRYAGLVPILAYLLIQLDLFGHASLSLQFAFIGAAAVLQTGAEAIAEETAYGEVATSRRAAGGLLAAVLVAATVALFSAAGGYLLAPAAGFVVAVALADRALAWGRASTLARRRRGILMTGWLAGYLLSAFLSFGDFGRQAFVGLSLWLLAAAALTALDVLFEGRPLFRRRPAGRRPGELA